MDGAHVRAIVLITEHDLSLAELIKTESPCCQVRFHIAALFLIRWLNCCQTVLSNLIFIFPLSKKHSVSHTEKYRNDFFFKAVIPFPYLFSLVFSSTLYSWICFSFCIFWSLSIWIQVPA